MGNIESLRRQADVLSLAGDLNGLRHLEKMVAGERVAALQRRDYGAVIELDWVLSYLVMLRHPRHSRRGGR